ncbi:MAG: riboflavin synthase [Chloroflexota bacterium]|nr:riboflavin synthase [Chloroflexota bacterium]
MFTGIVEEVGQVKAIRSGRITISANLVLKKTKPGDSICVNGACLTVTSLSNDSFSVDVMPETLNRTNLGVLQSGSHVNLERALTPESRIGGHFLQGHIDTTGSVLSVKPEGDALIMRFTAPQEIMHYVVEKGFIGIDGLSLTIIQRQETSFDVSLVSYTQEHTVLGQKCPGDTVNIEVDIIAKYVEQFVRKEKEGVTIDLLMEEGFI